MCIPSLYRQVRRETSRISTVHLSWSYVMLIPAYLSKSVPAFYTRCSSWTLKSLLRWLFWYFQHHFVDLEFKPRRIWLHGVQSNGVPFAVCRFVGQDRHLASRWVSRVLHCIKISCKETARSAAAKR